MYIVTGGAGFIGSAFVRFLNARGISNIIVVDALEKSLRWRNLRRVTFTEYLHRDEFLSLITDDRLPAPVTGVIHMGACSSTTETDADFLMRNNYRYSIEVARFCARHKVRLVYASSAATYGAGEHGYSDTTALHELSPLNAYGFSKQAFDQWMEREQFAFTAAGLKFFNVFGPGEYYKGDMASVVLKSWEQIKSTGQVRLFKSYRSDYQDGEQKRDFVYVQDCCEVMWWLLEHPEVRGLYNLGSGQARSWKDLAHAVFHALNRSPQIEFIPMPESLRKQYQYFTQADLTKLRAAGYKKPMTSLESAIKLYVQDFLEKGAGEP